MTTFTGTYGSAAMCAAIAETLDRINSLDMDIHTVSLVLSGQSGEFDFTVEATDRHMEERKWEGIAYRNGGVSGMRKAE